MPNLPRILEALIEPIGFLWLLNLLAALYCTRKRHGRAALFCWFVAGAITLVGSTPMPSQLLASLERPYASPQLDSLPSGDAVVMLGGVLGPSEHDVFHLDFGEAVDRALTAAELLRKGKAPVLVLGGGGGRQNGPSHAPWKEAALLEGWLRSWGIPATNCLSLATSRNTRDEALQVRDLAQERKWQRVLLVTSAYHMKRAEAIFRQLGVPVVPVACDFIGLGSLQREKPFNPIPTSGEFQKLDLYLHEQVGWVYYRLRGWVTGKSDA